MFFKTLSAFFFCTWAACLAPCAQAAPYRYDERHSEVLFTLKHLGVITVNGHFNAFHGEFTYNPLQVENGRVRLIIQAGSLDSGNAVRDKDLKSKKFFWTAQYPEIRFTSTSYGDVRGNRFNIYGLLTIRGNTNPVVFETKLLPRDKNAADGKLRFYTQTFIKRKDFKLGTENWFNPLIFITGETLKISLNVEGLPA